MLFSFYHRRNTVTLYRYACRSLAFLLTASLILTPNASQAQTITMPIPGTMINPSTSFTPTLLKGMTVHPENPLKLDFIVDEGDESVKSKANREKNIGSTPYSLDAMPYDLEEESQRLVNYFLAALTVPQGDLWVNLSPAEQDRIIPDALNQTELGYALLAQDYLLKQLTASLLHPDGEAGKEFWKRVYDKAFEKYGTTEIPVDTFHKVWITPKEASIYTHEQTVYVVDVKLDVMLEEDYVVSNEYRVQSTEYGKDSIQKQGFKTAQYSVPNTQYSDNLSTQIIRDIIIPELKREVNEGEHFAPLRQVVYSLVLAKWYKQNLTDSVLNKVYADKNLVAGVDNNNPTNREEIYAKYVEAYQKGVFDFVREETDSVGASLVDAQKKAGTSPAPTGDIIPRKYFSGGFEDSAMTFKSSSEDALRKSRKGPANNIEVDLVQVDRAMSILVKGSFIQGHQPRIGDKYKGLTVIDVVRLENIKRTFNDKQKYLIRLEIFSKVFNLGGARRVLNNLDKNSPKTILLALEKLIEKRKEQDVDLLFKMLLINHKYPNDNKVIFKLVEKGLKLMGVSNSEIKDFYIKSLEEKVLRRKKYILSEQKKKKSQRFLYSFDTESNFYSNEVIKRLEELGASKEELIKVYVLSLVLDKHLFLSDLFDIMPRKEVFDLLADQLQYLEGEEYNKVSDFLNDYGDERGKYIRIYRGEKSHEETVLDSKGRAVLEGVVSKKVDHWMAGEPVYRTRTIIDVEGKWGIGLRNSDFAMTALSAKEYYQSLEEKISFLQSLTNQNIDSGNGLQASIYADENKTFKQSIFANLPLTGQPSLTPVYQESQDAIKELIGLSEGEDLTLQPLNEIHTTIATLELASEVGSNMDRFKQDFAGPVLNQNSVELELVGPRLMPDGGVVMQYRPVNEGVYELRKFADEYMKGLESEGIKTGGVPSILHSTIATINDKTIPTEKLSQLNERFSRIRQDIADQGRIVVLIDRLAFSIADIANRKIKESEYLDFAMKTMTAKEVLDSSFQQDFLTAIQDGRGTYGLIKPDVSADSDKVKDIVRIIEEEGLNVRIGPRLYFTEDMVREMYAVHAQKGWFPQLMEFMTEDNGAIPMFIESEEPGAVEKYRMAVDKVRDVYKTDSTQNAVHGSDAIETALEETGIVFRFVEDMGDKAMLNNLSSSAVFAANVPTQADMAMIQEVLELLQDGRVQVGLAAVGIASLGGLVNYLINNKKRRKEQMLLSDLASEKDVDMLKNIVREISQEIPHRTDFISYRPFKNYDQFVSIALNRLFEINNKKKSDKTEIEIKSIFYKFLYNLGISPGNIKARYIEIRGEESLFELEEIESFAAERYGVNFHSDSRPSKIRKASLDFWNNHFFNEKAHKKAISSLDLLEKSIFIIATYGYEGGGHKHRDKKLLYDAVNYLVEVKDQEKYDIELILKDAFNKIKSFEMLEVLDKYGVDVVNLYFDEYVDSYKNDAFFQYFEKKKNSDKVARRIIDMHKTGRISSFLFLGIAFNGFKNGHIIDYVVSLMESENVNFVRDNVRFMYLIDYYLSSEISDKNLEIVKKIIFRYMDYYNREGLAFSYEGVSNLLGKKSLFELLEHKEVLVAVFIKEVLEKMFKDNSNKPLNQEDPVITNSFDRGFDSKLAVAIVDFFIQTNYVDGKDIANKLLLIIRRKVYKTKTYAVDGIDHSYVQGSSINPDYIKLKDKLEVLNSFDSAMTHGGIDLNDMNITPQGESTVNFKVDDAMIEDMLTNGVTGFVPVIQSITPIPSIFPLLGLVDDPANPLHPNQEHEQIVLGKLE